MTSTINNYTSNKIGIQIKPFNAYIALTTLVFEYASLSSTNVHYHIQQMETTIIKAVHSQIPPAEESKT